MVILFPSAFPMNLQIITILNTVWFRRQRTYIKKSLCCPVIYIKGKGDHKVVRYFPLGPLHLKNRSQESRGPPTFQPTHYRRQAPKAFAYSSVSSHKSKISVKLLLQAKTPKNFASFSLNISFFFKFFKILLSALPQSVTITL